MDATSTVDLSTALMARGLSTAGSSQEPGLQAIDLDVAPGTLTVIEGERADGAFELLRCLSGEVRPTAGTLRVFGVDVTAMPDGDRRSWLAQHVGSLLRSSELLGYLTVGENLDLARQGRQCRETLRRLASPELLKTMPADITQEQHWVVSLARVLASDHDVTVVATPVGATSDTRWMPQLRALVDLYSSTVLVGMGRRDSRLHHDRLVEIRSGSVVGGGDNRRRNAAPADAAVAEQNTDSAIEE